MSLDAIIHAVEYPGDGTAILRLRDPPNLLAGQRSLTVVNPPQGSLLDASIGERIRTIGNSIVIDDMLWAKRLGHVRIQLIERKK